MDEWNWDIKLSLALMGVVLCSLIAWAVVPVVKRMMQWRKYRKYAFRYVPHSTSHEPWRENMRRS